MATAAVAGEAIVVDTAEVVDTTVLAGTSVVVGGIAALETTAVVAGAVVSAAPLHVEATRSRATATAGFLTVEVCHLSPEGVVR